MLSINNKSWLILTMVSLLFYACNAQNRSQTPEWKEFISEEGKFKATFPGIPVKTVKEKDSPNGKIQNPWFEVSLPKSYFAIWYLDLPRESDFNQEELKTYYDDIRDGYSKTNF